MRGPSLDVLKFIIAAIVSLAVVIGAFWVILSDQHPNDNVAAFSLVTAVLAAWVVVVNRT